MGVSRRAPLVELVSCPGYLLHMAPGPGAQRFHGLPQGTAETGQLVVHARRNGRIKGSRHQTVSLQSSQREGEHSLRDAADHPFDLVEAPGSIAEQHDDQHAPFVSDAGEDRADGAAIVTCAIGKTDGHLSVLRYKACAFLRSLATVTNLVQVTVLYLR